MKETVASICAICLALTLTAAEYQFGFEKAKKDEKGNPVPDGWVWYAYFNKDYGTWSLSEDSSEGNFAMNVKANPDAKDNLRVYLEKPYIPANSGYTVEITASIKGKGSIGCGIYTYDKRKSFIKGQEGIMQAIDSPEYSMQTFRVIVQESPSDKEITSILPVFTFGKGSSFLIDNVKIVTSDK